MSLTSYADHAQHLADDLLNLLDEQDQQAAADLFHHESYEMMVDIPQPELKPVLVFLGKTQKQQHVQFAKLTGQARLRFWLRARYLALASANALRISETVEMQIGRGYRQAFRAIAAAVHPYPDIPSIDDILGREWG